MKRHIAILCFSLLVLLTACSNNMDETADADVKSWIHDFSTDQKTAASASVNATHLMVENEKQQEQFDLPEDEFFVSIAPFINQTHPCTYHSLTGCQSELRNASFDVYIEDVDGNVMIDETMQSFDNGFIDLWLPRNQEFNVRITLDDKEVEAPLSTYEEDPTCITTMQLM